MNIMPLFLHQSLPPPSCLSRAQVQALQCIAAAVPLTQTVKSTLMPYLKTEALNTEPM